MIFLKDVIVVKKSKALIYPGAYFRINNSYGKVTSVKDLVNYTICKNGILYPPFAATKAAFEIDQTVLPCSKEEYDTILKQTYISM